MESTTTEKITPIIVYHYPYSPYAKRIIWYLRLRGLEYLQCLQPPTLPRPSLALLGIKHRRIPIVAIGSDIYLDTRLILPKLESLIPSSPLRPSLSPTPSSATNLALQALFSLWSTAPAPSGLFAHAQTLLPFGDLPLLRDPTFQKDRADFMSSQASPSPSTGGETKEERKLEREGKRAESMTAICSAFQLLESTIFSDGRDWVLSSPSSGREQNGPSLADIEAIWLFHWAVSLPGVLDTTIINKEKFPRVFGWIERFQAAVAAKKGGPKVKDVSGEEARGIISSAQAGESIGIDTTDPLVRVYGLKKGDTVEVWPTDTGVNHRDVGRLEGIDAREVVFVTGEGFRVHAPREGFRVRPARAAGKGASL